MGYLFFPWGIVLQATAILHFVRDPEEPRRIVDTLVDALPDGSLVIASHATFEYMPPAQLAAVSQVADPQVQVRSGVELARLLVEQLCLSTEFRPSADLLAYDLID